MKLMHREYARALTVLFHRLYSEQTTCAQWEPFEYEFSVLSIFKKE